MTLALQIYESLCNPVGQAMLLNKVGTELNIVVGLCVGHDSLFFKHSEAPVTVLVVEPTVSGVHDLERILATTDHFGVPALVCINKVDVNPKRAVEVEAFCASRGIEAVGRIPFDTVVTEVMVQGRPVTVYAACPERSRRDGPVTEALRQVWQGVKTYLTLNEENEE